MVMTRHLASPTRTRFLTSSLLALAVTVLLVGALRAEEPAKTSDELLGRTFRFPKNLESVPGLLDTLVTENNAHWSQTSQVGTGSALANPARVRSEKVPWMASTAIADYREALRREFIAVVGKPDGRMTAAQLASLAARNRLPGGSGADAWLSAHDRDRDGALTIEEFVPSAAEIGRTLDLVVLTNSFLHGLPYPSGQSPRTSAAEYGIATSGSHLYASREEIERRIRAFAARIGGSTFQDAEGRLAVKDAEGNHVMPLPPDVIPLPKEMAEAELRRFLQKIGGTGEFAADKIPVLRGSDGAVIPLEKWPPFTQPPYHPHQ